MESREYVAETAAPTDRPFETLDARQLPPPQPLQNTLERLAELDDAAVLVQINDRDPQHLYPKLDDRGYEYETMDGEEGTVTVIWRAES
ncbi:MAG: DUF2249 domain-containing protein [Halobacteriales archaeon]